MLLVSILLTFTPSSVIAEHSQIKHDTEWLAYNIYHEARGESTEGKFTVALITINRVESPDFPNTIHDVITQPAQFSWFWDGKPDQPQESIAYQECFEVSKRVMSLWKSGKVKDVIRQMNLDSVKWYHNVSVRPSWADDYQLVSKVGKHLIYKDI